MKPPYYYDVGFCLALWLSFKSEARAVYGS